MIDTMLRHLEKAQASTALEELGLEEKAYAVLTLHRPSNVDEPSTFRRILQALGETGREVPIVLPMHPRTLERVCSLGLKEALEGTPGLRPVAPLGYLDFLKVQSLARLVLTDSGGVQEETTVLGVPCLTIRENTERPITLTQGTNVLVGTDPERIVTEARRALRGESRRPTTLPDLWDGQAAQRIADILEGALCP